MSLVHEGANKKKFLILKSMISKLDPAIMKNVEKILKEYQAKDTNNEGPLDEKAQTALKAVVRILTPLKDQLSPMLLHEVLSTAGLQMQAAEEQEGGEGFMHKSNTQSPEPIKEEHHIEAMKVAKDAFKKKYDEHIAKLGYQKYPPAEMQQKDNEGAYGHPGHVVEDDGQEDEQLGHQVGEGKHASMEEGMPMHHEEKEKEMMGKIHKSLLASVPKGSREAFEAIFKERSELVRKTARLEDALRTEIDFRKKKEFVEKAAGFKNLGVATDDLANTLKTLSEKAPDQYEAVEKMLKLADKQAGGIYKELGSSLPGRGSDADAKIDAAVNAIVQKSGNTTYADAYTKFIETPEGQRLYSEYKDQRGGI